MIEAIERRYARAEDGTRIHYRVEGPEDGVPLLLSHSLGVTLDTWAPQVAALADRFRVVRYDARGHGGSDAPEGIYEIGELARDALAVLDAEGIAQAHLLGLSMGGMVGMWIATHAPRRIGRLVLANTTPHIPLRDMWNSRIETALGEGMAPIAAPTIGRWLGEAFKARDPEAVEQIVARMRGMSPVGYAGCCAALREADQRETISRIAAPTLVITGSADLATTPALAESIAAAIRGARAEVIPDAGHLSNVEQPEAFNRIVRSFLV
ncbi:MAG: 3-oxoadipate enol-lactonase [Variovorax sp.]|nr:3-oxoadipate enol-lactonase [Variovorax sp.]